MPVLGSEEFLALFLDLALILEVDVETGFGRRPFGTNISQNTATRCAIRVTRARDAAFHLQRVVVLE